MDALPTLHAIAAILIAVAMFVAFARDRVAPELISLATIAAIALVLYFAPLPGKRPEDGLALAFGGFGHYALITICALMVMGRGLVVTGALDPLVAVLGKVWKFNVSLGLLVTLLLAFLLSMMVNDTPVLVLLLPVLVQLAGRGAMPSSRTLMPINAAVLIGGMATTIGTSTNLLVVSIAEDLGLPHMPVFHFTPIVLLAALIALPYLWLVMPRMLPDNSVSVTHAPRRFVATMRIREGSENVGRATQILAEKMPPEFAFARGTPDVIPSHGRLTVTGTHAALEEATRTLGAALAPEWVLDRVRTQAIRQGQDLVVVEMALTADSPLVGINLSASGIADQFELAVLGIHFAQRPFQPPRGQSAEDTLAEGDVLLVMGQMSHIQDFANRDAVLLLEGAHEVPRRSKALLALGIMAGVILPASLGLLPIAIGALAGAILMLATGCVRFDRIGRALSAKVIVLVAASIAVGKMMLESGAADWLGHLLSGALQYLPPAAVLAVIMVFVTLLTNFASNATAATVGTPIAFSIAQRLNLPPEPLVLAVLFGCNLCYATPIAYQTNMLIMAEGGYNFRDYLRTGLPLVAIMVVALSSALTLSYGL